MCLRLTRPSQAYGGRFLFTFVKTLGLSLLALIAVTSQSRADVNNDIMLQHADDQYRRSVIDPVLYERISGFLKEGYPPASVMLHGVSLGVPLEDIVEMSVRQDTDNAQYFYDLASSLLPSLPGWVCRSQDRYHPLIGLNSDSVEQQPTLSDVANQYFAGRSSGMRLPAWRKGERHLDVPITDLAKISQQSTHWYQSSTEAQLELHPGVERPVFVALYRDNQQIRTDADSTRLQTAIDAGQQTLPVIVLFNETYQQAVSEYGDSANIRNIAGDFFNDGRELTAVPAWQSGDYHIDANVNELAEIFELPTQDMVSPEKWNLMTRTNSASRSMRPFKVTLLQSGERLWIDEPERLAAARHAGAETVPVVFYFHSMDRMACGVQSNACQARLCDATIAGGGNASICTRSAGATPAQQSEQTRTSTLIDGDSPQLSTPPSNATTPPDLIPRTPLHPPVPPMEPSTASPS